jgi:hypothetical protein
VLVHGGGDANEHRRRPRRDRRSLLGADRRPDQNQDEEDEQRSFQFKVQSDRVDTSFTKTRLPEYAGCPHVATSDTL